MYGFSFNDSQRDRFRNHSEVANESGGDVLDKMSSEFRRMIKTPLSHNIPYGESKTMPRRPKDPKKLPLSVYLHFSAELLQYWQDEQDNFIEDIIYLDECLQVADEKHLWVCKSIMITNDILQHATENDELELYNASIFSENGVEYLEYMLDFGDQDVATTRHNRNWFYAAEIDHVTKLLHDKYKECAEHIDDIRTDLSLKIVGIDNR